MDYIPNACSSLSSCPSVGLLCWLAVGRLKAGRLCCGMGGGGIFLWGEWEWGKTELQFGIPFKTSRLCTMNQVQIRQNKRINGHLPILFVVVPEEQAGRRWYFNWLKDVAWINNRTLKPKATSHTSLPPLHTPPPNLPVGGGPMGCLSW